MKNKKLNIEYLRVVAIICTIMIHISNIFFYNFEKISNLDFLVSTIFNIIGRICVPIFFMISGSLLMNETYDKKKYYKRIHKTLLILIIWSIIYVVFNGYYKNNIIETIVYSLFNSTKTQTHLWYLYALLGIYISLPFIQSMVKNLTREKENLFIVLWLAFSGLISIIVPISRSLTNSNIDVSYYIPLINGTYYLGYFVLGYVLSNRLNSGKKYSKYNLTCILLFIFFSLISIVVTYTASINNNSVFEAMTWYRSIFIVISSASIFSLFIINEDKFKNNNILKISNLTFGVYLIHMTVVILIRDNINLLRYSSILVIPIVTFIVYLVSLLLTYVIKKIPFINKIIG